MAGGHGGRSVAAMTKAPPLAIAISALVASYAIGAAIALSAGVGELGDVLGNGTKLSAPLFLIVIEALAALAILTRRAPLAGAIVLAAASGLSLAAAAFDGDVGHEGLTTAEVAWQAIEVACAAAVFALAVTRIRRRPVAA
jgi:hypothetical protein